MKNSPVFKIQLGNSQKNTHLSIWCIKNDNNPFLFSLWKKMQKFWLRLFFVLQNFFHEIDRAKIKRQKFQ